MKLVNRILTWCRDVYRGFTDEDLEHVKAYGGWTIPENMTPGQFSALVWLWSEDKNWLDGEDAVWRRK